MSFTATVFRILIASPSDVGPEREIAVRTIQEWNDLNSAERQIALLPLRWETHATPEFGKRPQEIINRQIVDHCDLVVGVFWTRVGTPTGLADGGTIEEIERVAQDGKPVMLYFSQVKEQPDKLDLEQLARLRDFKKKTLPNALIESYSDHVEFKEKLSKQLERQLRMLLAGESNRGGDPSAPPVTDIVFRLADPAFGKEQGTEITLERTFVDVTHPEAILDYSPPAEKGTSLAGKARGLLSYDTLNLDTPNKGYYREKAGQIVRTNFFAPLRFCLKNRGALGARDVYVSLTLSSPDGVRVHVLPIDQLRTDEPSKTTNSFGLFAHKSPTLDDAFGDDSTEWTEELDIGALQPQRELSQDVAFAVGAKQNCKIVITAKIFADTLAQPIVQELVVNLQVARLEIEGADFFALVRDAS